MRRKTVFLALSFVAACTSDLPGPSGDDGASNDGGGSSGPPRTGGVTGGGGPSASGGSSLGGDPALGGHAHGGHPHGGEPHGGEAGSTGANGGANTGGHHASGGTNTGGDTGSETGGSGSGGPLNGCHTFVDRTDEAADRAIAWTFNVASSGEACLRVRTGQSVSWTGQFGTHPIGASGGDAPSPIPYVSSSASSELVVLFETPGRFGFQCENHWDMRGAVLVEDPE